MQELRRGKGNYEAEFNLELPAVAIRVKPPRANFF
jgi:hypothetical protein